MARRRRSKRGGLPPGAYLRRRRRYRRALMVVGVLCLALIFMLDRAGCVPGPAAREGRGSGEIERGGEMARYDGRWFEVVSVVSGHTLEVDASDGDRATTRVRLWGVNAPVEQEPWAREAFGFVRALTEGGRVRLMLEEGRPRGGLGRVLAHVELEDGRVLNERLLAAGLAEVEDRWEHGRMSRYERVEGEAREAGVGIWGDF